MIRLGVVGVGNMGSSHARRLAAGEIKGASLVAVCDNNPKRLQDMNGYGSAKAYSNLDDMLKDENIDGVIIATPHYDHPNMGIQALNAGKHILVEKPIGVYTKAVQALNEKAKASDQVFTIMYNQRTNPLYQKVKQFVEENQLGELVRVHWICTDWYRTQGYYDSGGWRATWKGEGGGALLNQCPHQIDLLQWMCGMPKKVMSFMGYGKYHDIEVEDDVTTYFEYENGATGLFVTSTGEAPGINRLEISGTQGRLVVENNEMTFYRNEEDVATHLVTSKGKFEKPILWTCKVEIKGQETSHVGIMQDFVDTINGKEKPLSPGLDGIKGLMLTNAMHLSDWTKDWVTLPLDENLFEQLLMEKVKTSKDKHVEDEIIDLRGSH